jgi:hypothetical protein
MQISGEVFQRLSEQARSISEMAQSQLVRAAMDGKSEQELTAMLLKLATQRAAPPKSLPT